jgi:hypothetical protein
LTSELHDQVITTWMILDKVGDLVDMRRGHDATRRHEQTPQQKSRPEDEERRNEKGSKASITMIITWMSF